jgi:hypothetical protein
MALAIFAAQRFELAAIVTHVRSPLPAARMDDLPSQPVVRLDRYPLSLADFMSLESCSGQKCRAAALKNQLILLGSVL